MASTTSSHLAAVQLSGNEKEVIERKLSLLPDPVDIEKDLSDFYEISRCVDAIKSGNFEKVRKMFFIRVNEHRPMRLILGCCF